MTDWIGETFTSDAGWSHLEALVDVGSRMAGSEGERRGAEATRAALADAGARDARLDSFELKSWRRGSSAVRAGEADAADGVVGDCIALPRSPSGTATGDLVDAGHGLPREFDRDLAGAVVVASSDVPDWYDRPVHRREKYCRSVEAGAAAFVFCNHVAGCLAPTGSVGTGDRPIGAIPAVGVSKEVGDRLRRRHEGSEVTVEVDADAGGATSQNVHADVGPDTDGAVLLTSHVDAHDIAEGAGDNAAGTAMVVEVVRALAARESDLDTRVHAACFGAEEVGLVGSTHDAERRDLDSVRAVVNVDGAVRGRTLECVTNGFEDLADAATAAAGRFDHPVATPPELAPHSDHWPYVARGVPGCHVTSQTGESGRGWGHTRADTLDKLEVRTLREQAVVLTELVVELAGADASIDRRDPAAIADQLVEEGLAEGMRVTGDWPY